MSEEIKQDKPSENTSELDLTAMTREEALVYMGLSSDADIKEIDDRFSQLV